MKKNHILGLILFFLASYQIQAQKSEDDVLLTINGGKIYKSEFERIYHKNNPSKTSTSQDIQDYFELFINFKLRVLEAQRIGLDTSAKFVNELEGYRNQLSKPYLSDESSLDSMMNILFQNASKEKLVSHIFLKLEANAKPEDTLKMYNKLEDIRKKIAAGGKFEDLANQFSDDLTSKANGGNIGWYAAFKLPKVMDRAAFSLKINEVSKPIRSDFGYHLMIVKDERAARGEVKIAHILLLAGENPTEEKKNALKDTAQMIYDRILKGEDFAELVKKYSHDKASANKGGELQWFGAGRMITEYVDNAFLLNKGEISKPFSSMFGWHIIKLIDKKPVESFENMKGTLREQASSDQIRMKGTQKVLAKIKKQFNYAEYYDNSDYYQCLDTNIWKGKWDAKKADKYTKKLFSIGNKTITQSDFTAYLAKMKQTNKLMPKELAKFYYPIFQREVILKYGESHLEDQYEDFKYLMQEYHDGILLFELTDSMVWTKAVKDTLGLEKFYEANKQNYLWDNRLEANIYKCFDAKIAKEVRKIIKSRAKKGLSNDDILKAINKDSTIYLTIESGKYVKADHKVLQKADSKVGISPDINVDGKLYIVEVVKLLPSEPKLLSECRGLVTADYQTKLEKEWLAELRSKYKIEVNQEVLKKVQ